MLYSCANEGAPVGGPKDLDPPEVLASSPDSGSINFKSKTIVLQFNEYTALQEPNERVTISPPLQEPLKFSVQGKRLTITLPKDSLKSNTTYLISFDEALKDITEGNQILNFQYVFSTGDNIDSLKLDGIVSSAIDNKAMDNISVQLYATESDTVFKTQKPDYFTKTNKDGKFSLQYLAPGKYKLYALKDANRSYTYDVFSEEIAFHQEDIVIGSDTTWHIPLKLFQQKSKSLKLLDCETGKPGKLSFIYNNPISSFSVVYNGSEKLYQDTIIHFNPSKDTISFWYSTALYEQQKIIAVANDSIVDTLSVTKQVTEEVSKEALAISAQAFPLTGKPQSLHPLAVINLLTNRPLKEIDTSLITLTTDSFSSIISPELSQTENPVIPLKIKYKWKAGNKYELSILPGAFADYFGNINDSISMQYVVPSKEEFGNLIVSFPDLNDSMIYIAQLVDQKQNVIQESTLSKIKKQIEYQLIMPGKYSVKLIEDRNANGKWDTGDWENKLQPEKIKISAEPVEIRSNWDVEIEMLFNL